MINGRAHILIVDDLLANRDLLARRVAQMQHDSTLAENGAQALQLLSERDFDLMLLDIQMPELDGYQVLERMKQNSLLQRVPVIVISAVSELESLVRCIELGAEDYLLKPFNNVLLKARLGASLEKKQLRDREREAMRQLQIEEERSQRLLLSIFPASIAARLKAGHTSEAEHFEDATLLFAGIAGFEHLTQRLSPARVVALLNTVFSSFDALAEAHGVQKIKTVRDVYLAAAGVPLPRIDHVEAIAELALSMQRTLAGLETDLPEPLSLRIGIDTGPVMAGVIGTSRFAYDLWGSTVNRAGEMQAYGLPGGIQITLPTYRRLQGRYIMEERGAFYVSGAGETQTFLLKGRAPG